MRRRAILAAAGLVLLAGPAPEAEARSRSRAGSLTTWRGTWSGSAARGCAGGTCWRSRSVTGPHGQSWSRQGSVTRIAPGDISGTGTMSGPRGSVTRSFSADRW